MATIHDTVMRPTKLDVLRTWLPAQPWYLGGRRAPTLAKAGGFRLDDPAGEVGIEFLVLTDGSGDQATTYHLPLTYRGSALAGAGDALAGTAEHGVLGPRWIYDGTHDPVLVAQLVALIQGAAEPQAQSVSNTPDPTVIAQLAVPHPLTAAGSVVTASGPQGTDLRIQTASTDHGPNGQLLLRINRILLPGGTAATDGDAGQPCLSARWRLADGSLARGTFVTARYLAP
jgi:Maltokinase N-terminal cap domain